MSIGFSSQGYWHGLPFPPSKDLPNLGSKLVSLAFPALAGRFFTTIATWEATILKKVKKEKAQIELENSK